MSSTDKLVSLKSKVERLQRDKAKAEGALGQLKQQLLQDFGCKTIKQAKTKLAELKSARDEAEVALGEAIKKFEAKWKAVLEGNEES